MEEVTKEAVKILNDTLRSVIEQYNLRFEKLEDKIDRMSKDLSNLTKDVNN